jgi:hypothetical protein
MKKKFKPHNQLFLFSNTLDPRIETWFAGSVIIEQAITTQEESCEDLNKLIQFIRLLDIGDFKYVTNVINYKSSNLLFVKLSGLYPVMCQLSNKKSYLELNRLHRLLTAWSGRFEVLNTFFYFERNLLQYLKGTSERRKQAYKYEMETLDLLESNNQNIKEVLIHEFNEKFVL